MYVPGLKNNYSQRENNKRNIGIFVLLLPDKTSTRHPAISLVKVTGRILLVTVLYIKKLSVSRVLRDENVCY